MVARVLVVEDDSTVSGVLSAYLRKAGFDPRIAADGTAALQEWTQWRPHVVILDVMLPGMSGLEVLARRRAEDDGAAVIILSARGDEEDRLLGLEVGLTTMLSSPSAPGRLCCASELCCGARNDWVPLRCCRARWPSGTCW